MKRRTGARSGVLVALVVGAGGALASCSLIVGVGDYAVGDSGTDGTTGTADVGGGGDVGADRTETGGGGGDAMRDEADVTVADVSQADMTLDVVGDVPVDSVSDQGGGRFVDSGDTGSPDAGDTGDTGIVDTGSIDSGSIPDADAAAPEAAPTCGQGIPTGQSSFTSLVSTCVLAVSCDPFLFPVTLSDCITRDELRATGSFACLSTIVDCNGYYNCQGVRYATLTECPGFTSTCDTVNNVATDCSSAVAFPGVVTNCTKQGGTCATYTDSAGNSRADCIVVPSCTATDAGRQCSSNNKLNDCSTGVGYGLDCTAITALCTTAASAGTNCYPLGTACGSDGGATCSGGTLTECEPTGQGFNFDCTRAGGTCSPSTTGGAACTSPGCSPTGCSEACGGANGATLTACVGGAQYNIDCTKYVAGTDTDAGFTSCGITSGKGYCLP